MSLEQNRHFISFDDEHFETFLHIGKPTADKAIVVSCEYNTTGQRNEISITLPDGELFAKQVYAYVKTFGEMGHANPELIKNLNEGRTDAEIERLRLRVSKLEKQLEHSKNELKECSEYARVLTHELD